MILLYITTSILAFCSISYELLLAQSMASVLGSTALAYTFTLGFYICSLGFGSLLGQVFKNNPFKHLIFVEMQLCLLAILAPLCILGLIRLSETSSPVVIFSISFLFISWVGLLSGIEIPLIGMICKKHYQKDADKKLLSIDYALSALAALSHPFIFYAHFGLIYSCILLTTLNLIALNLLCVHKPLIWVKIYSIALGSFLVFAVFNKNLIEIFLHTYWV